MSLNGLYNGKCICVFVSVEPWESLEGRGRLIVDEDDDQEGRLGEEMLKRGKFLYELGDHPLGALVGAPELAFFISFFLH